ncbi:restriction endonuclease [Paenibacillus sp. YN15]|uniref:restriction endonuclease n=1 Tax=Paenibacillus sp. YN15 TaxID=1742774 RepID=UPI000DCDA99D|nr:restriction endonuclease [Paenibacillus sp. YN15]RAV01229.1 hypothetical protein DQG13_12670 [Paenibacillus sp. YN15]
MPRPAKKRQLPLELSITWTAGCVLLLLANMTIFRQLNASVGDPWFNYMLGAAILLQSLYIGVRLYRLHGEIVYANSQIEKVDGLDDVGFAEYISGLCADEGWSSQLGSCAAAGAALYLEKADTRLHVILHTARRRLTGDYVASAAGSMKESPHPAGEAELWCLTNTSFTDRARRAAADYGLRLVDRKELIRRLAKSGTMPFFHNARRKK